MNLIRRWLLRRKGQTADIPAKQEEPVRRVNPYLCCIREILEQILEQRKLEYGAMHLLMIDTDTEPESFLEEDEVEMVLEQLSGDLNFLTILTQRPAYFEKYVETMYEENGLLVHLDSKEKQRNHRADTILDFEQKGDMWNSGEKEPFIYLPIYKKQWENGENLDISIPIGYNTVIVKGIRAAENRGRVL